jgi:hypothetical protein
MLVGDKMFGVVSYAIVRSLGAFSPRKCLYFPPLGVHFVRFLKHIQFGYTALHCTVDRLNLQLSTCMICLCKYHELGH